MAKETEKEQVYVDRSKDGKATTLYIQGNPIGLDPKGIARYLKREVQRFNEKALTYADILKAIGYAYEIGKTDERHNLNMDSFEDARKKYIESKKAVMLYIAEKEEDMQIYFDYDTDLIAVCKKYKGKWTGAFWRVSLGYKDDIVKSFNKVYTSGDEVFIYEQKEIVDELE